VSGAGRRRQHAAIGPSARFNGHVGVANAEVVNSGLHASNGVVHVIDRVIQ
jgi:uncharacterized surface protein with fasciclin (FAS1) repeats